MKAILIFSLFFVFFPVSTPADMHPVHVSVTTIEFNEKEKSLELTCRVFTNDYERILKKLYKGKIDLLGTSQKSRMDSLASAYMLSHLALSVNGNKVEMNFVGYEQDEDAILNYLEVRGIGNVKEIGVNNTVLYDLWEKQQSVIHVMVRGERKSTRLSNPAGFAGFYF